MANTINVKQILNKNISKRFTISMIQHSNGLYEIITFTDSVLPNGQLLHIKDSKIYSTYNKSDADYAFYKRVQYYSNKR